jgi:signal transduction histidine kinase
VAETFFEDIKRYVGFDEADSALLRAFKPLVEPHFSSVSDRFYQTLLRHEGARRAITGGDAQVERLKRTLIVWMDRLFDGPHDEGYYELRARIGRRHVLIGLPQQYMLTAMNGMRVDFVRIGAQEMPWGEELIATMRALHRILDIELAIMLQTYKEDSDARLRGMERRRADERIRAIETLVAGLAHEVRNPVNAAALQLALLKRRAERIPGGETLSAPAEVAHLELLRLETLVRSLMDFARPTLSSRRPCDAGAVLRASAAAHAALAEERGVAVAVEVAPALPPVLGDAERLKQVFDNVVRNALEATPRGGRVTARAFGGEAQVIIAVADTGTGIPPDALDRVFDPFFTTKAGGTGMGLPMAQAIVREHGGTMRVESAPGAGTTVEVRLPAAT